MIFSLDGSVFRREGTPYLNTKVMTDAPLDMEMRKRYLGMFWGSYCSRVGTFGTESAVRKRGGSRNLPYLNAKPQQIPLLGTQA